MRTLDVTGSDVKDALDEMWRGSLPALQTAVYVMCGGGWLGQTAAESPAHFYIDGRVGTLPYPPKAILQAVAVLIELAKLEGLDPAQLPRRPLFHNCGVF